MVVWVGIPALIFVTIGAYFSQYFQYAILEIALAIFLIITSVLFIIFKTITIKPTIKNSILGGVFSGALAGLVGTGGAIRGITLTAFNLSIQTFIATSAIIDLGIDISRSVVYYLNGYIHKHDIYLIPLLLMASVLGTYIGKLILNHISKEKFKLLVLLLIFITGVLTLIKSIA